MSARVAVNVKLEIQQTVGSPLVVTGATPANPVVITSAAHGLSNGDWTVFTVSDGMVQLDGILARVANKTTDTWEAENVNGLLFSALVGGSPVSTYAYKITAFTTLANATNITFPDGTPARLDATRLYSVRKEYLFGLPDDPGGTINAQYDPHTTAMGLIKIAARAQTRVPMRLTWREGYKTSFVALVQGGEGFNAQQNTIVTSDIALQRVGEVIPYAS